MNKQTDLWTGKFGDEYHKRQVHDFVARVRMWRDILYASGGFETALEVGCGTGVNLQALRRLNYYVHLFGIEANASAAHALSKSDICNTVFSSTWEDFISPLTFDLVFTSGVLIHVHPDNRKAFMQKIIEHSNKYVIAIEYFSPEEREVSYRGHDAAMWTADYGQMYMDLGLKLIDCKFYYKPLTGLDNLTMWIFEK